MSTNLIKMADGMLIEVEAMPGDVQQISFKKAKQLQKSLANLEVPLINLCKPFMSAWKELNQDMNIQQAEIEFGISFEGEGNIYLAKAKSGANLSVKLILKPKTRLKKKNVSK